MKTKEQLIEIFHLACADAKPERMDVFRYIYDVRHLTWGGSVIILKKSEGKNSLLFIEEGKTIGNGVHLCELTDFEHHELRIKWERTAQIQHIIMWKKKVENLQVPETVTPEFVGCEVFYLQTLDAFELVWTKEMHLAKRFPNREKGMDILKLLKDTHENISLNEVGINNN